MQKGFTLIELLVTIAIIAILAGIVLFSIIQYINKSKDAAISGALSVLIPAGEVYYDRNGVEGYIGFCENPVVENSFSQIPTVKDCNATTNAWAACALKLTDNPDAEKAFCVDSRGIKREIQAGCSDNITFTECPDNQ